MAATPVWLAAAEAALNRNLAAQPRAADLLRRLTDKSLQVDVTGVMRLRATSCAGRLVLARGDDSPADAIIAGTPGALLSLVTAAGNRPAGQAAAQVRGDAEVAAAFRELLREARPDFEEELSRWVGDVPARRVGVFARDSLQWLRRTRESVAANVAEYLQEESRDLVNKTELEEFLRGVDDLREAGDRAAARLLRLERRLQGGV
jgi:ubiquinone biosynthesis protein UbiJ